MPMKARREKEKKDMKNAILDAASKIIAEEGYDKLSMRKIADVIDYTPTTIYSYYKDKAEIVDGISRRIHDKIMHDVKVALDDSKSSSIDIQLKFMFMAFLYSIANNPEMGNAVIKSGTGIIFGPSDDGISQERNGVMMLRNFLAQGQQKGVFRELDDNMSWMLITALVGFSLNSIENQLYLDESWPHLVEIYADMLVRGLLLGRAEL